MADTVIAPRYQMRYEQLVNTPVLDRIPYFHDREIEYILEVSKAEQENVALRAERDRLKASLELVYDRWDNGTPCFEAGEDGQIEEGERSLGNAIKLSFAEEQEILNLIVDKAEDFEEACANCGKPLTERTCSTTRTNADPDRMPRGSQR